MKQVFSHPKDVGMLVLDFGSQYTLLIARRLRELGYYTEVIDGGSQNPPSGFRAHGIILSGGPDSVGEAGARKLPTWVLEAGVPVLGICYGLQLLVEGFGGRVSAGHGREYGKAFLNLDLQGISAAKRLFDDIPNHSVVWMSHGDGVSAMPDSFSTVGISDGKVVAAVAHKQRAIFGLQFHPEVQHSEYGGTLLRNFASAICGCPENWHALDMRKAATDYIRESVAEGCVLAAVSGGVDSTVAAALMAEALRPEQLTAVFVDHGLLRKNEVPWVSEKLRGIGVKDLRVLDCRQNFFADLVGKTDPEEKRKLIGRRFISEFELFAATASKKYTHLGQGTLYPDVIESAGHGAGSKVIKTHHNVGGLPDRLALKLVEPFRFLFKDEVRIIGRQVGLPDELVDRHPFPGPGLAVRILGEVTPAKAALLQEIDHIFIHGLREHGLYGKAWQAFAVLLPVQSVGVMGDGRTYQYTCALRAVTSTDGMTAEVAELPLSFLTHISDQIVRGVDGINRVVFDITSKPPATIEWE